MTTRETLRSYISAMLGSLKDCHADPEDVRAVLGEFLGSDLASKEIKIGMIRHWPDGMAARVEKVWLDLPGFTIDYKLFDLARVLAEFGYTLKLYEGAPERAPELPGYTHVQDHIAKARLDPARAAAIDRARERLEAKRVAHARSRTMCAAADEHAAHYADDQRECIGADVRNAFYAGAQWKSRQAAPALPSYAGEAIKSAPIGWYWRRHPERAWAMVRLDNDGTTLDLTDELGPDYMSRFYMDLSGVIPQTLTLYGPVQPPTTEG